MLCLYKRKIFTSKRMIMLLCSVILILIATTFYYYHGGYDAFGVSTPQIGLEFFYENESTVFHVWVFTIILFLSSNIFSSEIIVEKNNHFAYMIKERIGAKKYFLHNIIFNSLLCFSMMVIIQFILIVFINFFLVPIKFDFIVNTGTVRAIYEGFVSNRIYNMLLYIILSSFGYMIFSNFIYALNLFIKNQYLCKGSSLMIGLVGSALPAILSGILYENVVHNRLILYIFAPLYLPNLLTPGNQIFGRYVLTMPTWLIFLVGVIYLGLPTLVLLYKSYHREYHYE